MEKLKFPVFRESLPPPILPMDHYAKFIEELLLHPIHPRLEAEERDKITIINVPFRLK